MTNLTASARLKVKQDTCFLRDPNGGVYFRNNSGSFRIKGDSIYHWIEKLWPMFNGKHTLEELTAGLSTPYRNRVFEIGDILQKNGFVRDVSCDESHKLQCEELNTYASQIEWIESFTNSGAHHFQLCRNAKVLLLGCGSFVVSMVRALAETGFTTIYVQHPTSELVKENVHDATIEVIPTQDWREAIIPFDWVLYVSEDVDPEKISELQRECRKKGKSFFPAVCLKQIGLAGPVTLDDHDGCFESAWRRLHSTALLDHHKLETYSSIGKDMLANIIAFELFKAVSGLSQLSKRNHVYLLDLVTLESTWYWFPPHPLVNTNTAELRFIHDVETRMTMDSKETSHIFQLFSQLTSEKIGIFHLWEEKSLKQLPLSQCYVQPVNPLSTGPAELLEKKICVGFTHEEARREAGLIGIEMYGSKLVHSYLGENQFLGVGAGDMFAEAVLRGLQTCLNHELEKREWNGKEIISPITLEEIKDRHCEYYLNIMKQLNRPAKIFFGTEVAGFPVIWVCLHDQWYQSAGINITLALRKTLERALMNIQPQKDISLIVNQNHIKPLHINMIEDFPKLLNLTLTQLKQYGLQLLVYDFPLEPILKKHLDIYAVRLSKEEV
ncbi:putative thiazole-containing bacteriocin maturation protein [Bacillus sp. CLL-7-23]|uniref:Thiazole-containing bacteriocin maturation protein n=1 Tax=Bacillus changyiensis TaxID=3004103 RepID=A0ABT4X833_9BACI|nr:putative thiazole-containing bacteriocin maturation protein [Bacillus changyiensis]MDA7028445.1 putative thiazole-containing bacteriocin maturation protein [Bacillus changyiensis]